MENIENRYKVDYDLKKKCVVNAKYKQGDVNSSILEVHLKNDGLPINISGQVIEFRFLKRDGTKVYQDSAAGVTILDGANGVVECVLMSNTLSYPGLVECEIHRSMSGNTLTTSSFNFTVEGSIGEGLESQNYISAFETMKVIQAQTNNIMRKQLNLLNWQKISSDKNFDSIIIDTLTDEDGINKASSSAYVYEDYTLKTTNTSTIIWNPETSNTTVNFVYIIADYELNGGSISFYVSRNGGTNFTLIPENVLTSITSQPSGNSIVIKVVLTSSSLNSIGCGLTT